MVKGSVLLIIIALVCALFADPIDAVVRVDQEKMITKKPLQTIKKWFTTVISYTLA